MKTEYRIDNGMCLGIRVLEIKSIPYSVDENYSIKNNVLAQERIINELYQLDRKDIALEILWFSEKIDNNIHNSQLKIFVILRMIKNNSEIMKSEFNTIVRSILNSLKMQNYEVDEIVYTEPYFDDVLSKINDSKIYAIVKKENLSVNQILPYYYSSHLPVNNETDMNSLISAFTESNGASLSFQLIPTVFYMNELATIRDYSDRLGLIYRGMNNGQILLQDDRAKQPKDYYDFYYERKDSAKFLYNIIVTGKAEDIGSIATKVISQLKVGNSMPFLAFNCLDISEETASLKKQFPNYVWNINTILLNKYRNQALIKNSIVQNLYRLPYIVSSDEATAFFRIPYGDDNTIGIKINKSSEVKEIFDAKIFDEHNIKFGKLKNISNDRELEIGCSEKSFTKHALVVGMPGSGKTTFSINMLLQFSQRHIPFLAIEPTKTEYRAMIDAVNNLQIFTPGNSNVSPFIVNPFIPPKGISIEKYIPALANAFKAAFSMPSPLDMIFLKAIRRAYTKYGWKDYSTVDDDVQKFGMFEFIKVFKNIIEASNYGKEVKGNLESAGTLRLMNLLEQNSNIYDNINTIPIEDLLTKPTVIELNSIENAEQKALIMALLLINICIYTKNNHLGDGNLKNVVLIDEAHILLNPDSNNSQDSAGAGASTVKAIQDMIVEIRSYGTSIIIADQAPTKVTREIVGNTDIKVAFRLVQSVEKSLISDSTNMDNQQVENLSRLKPGEANVHYNALEKAQLVMTSDIREDVGIRLSVPDDEIKERMGYWKGHKSLLIPYAECLCTEIKCNECDFKSRADAEFFAASIYDDVANKIKDKAQCMKVVAYAETLLRKKFTDIDESKVTIIKCFKIKLLRKILLNGNFELSDGEIKKILDWEKE